MGFNKREMCRTPQCGCRDAEMVRQWIIQSCCIDPDKIHRVDNDFFVDGEPWFYSFENGECVSYYPRNYFSPSEVNERIGRQMCGI
jgi:hypothetical protein